MNRPRLIKGLKIGWTAFWSVLAVLLIVLWVLGQWSVDNVTVPVGGKWCFGMGSLPGACGVSIWKNSGAPRDPVWRVETESSDRWWNMMSETKYAYASRVWGVLDFARGSSTGIRIPDWLLVSFVLSLLFVPWLHFSLRTLLIITTLVAIVLGLIVWAR